MLQNIFSHIFGNISEKYKMNKFFLKLLLYKKYQSQKQNNIIFQEFFNIEISSCLNLLVFLTLFIFLRFYSRIVIYSIDNYIYIYIYIYTNIYIYKYVHIYIYIYIYICVYAYIYTYVYIYIYMSYLSLYICIYISRNK